MSLVWIEINGYIIRRGKCNRLSSIYVFDFRRGFQVSILSKLIFAFRRDWNLCRNCRDVG